MRGSARSASDQQTHAAAKPARSLIKRAIDITGSAVTLFFIAPLLLLIALVIRLHDGGSVFYGHRRLGLAGAEFTCWKFRTMVPDAHQVLTDHLAANPEAEKEWLETQKLTDDPRVTGIGAFLRKTSLDEIPQLWNVLIGEMSLIGPRPIVRSELDRYGKDRRYYLLVRPGISGLWQVSGRSNTTYERRIAFDREYAIKWSFKRDLEIILKTLPAVLKADGAR